MRGCIIHDSANGLFTSHLTQNILISRNYIYDNGIENSIYQHNTYTESMGIVYEYNQFGPLRSNCPGNNLKDRSAGTVIRYNWIEAGNRQLDLVESDYQSFVDDPSYNATFVYGNILIEPDNAGNSQIIHTTASPGHLALTNGQGQLALYANYFTQGYANSFEDTSASILGSSGNITGTDPGFSGMDTQDFTLVSGSVCVNKGTSLATGAANYPLTDSYVKHMDMDKRMMNGSAWDMGAFEQ